MGAEGGGEMLSQLAQRPVSLSLMPACTCPIY